MESMTCITCTDKKGHIFLAHIYELQYPTGSGWQKGCRKGCLISGVGGSVISRWIVPNVFKFGAVDPVVEMVFDNEMHIFYAKTEAMKLQVLELGQNEEGIKTQKDPNSGDRQSTEARAAGRSAKPSIVYISPLSSLG